MFDIAFSELVVICVVALIVIGPEKLPKLARTVGALTGRVQKYMTQIKEEVNREARFAELQKLQDEIQSAATAKQTAIRSELDQIATDHTQTAEPSNHSVSQPAVNPEKQSHQL